MLLNLPDALPLVLLSGGLGLSAGWHLQAWVARRRTPPAPPPQPETAAPRGTPATPAHRPAEATPDMAAPRPPVTAAAPARPPAADLLLVDDSAVARAKLRKLFEAAGYQVHLASDGVEALALLDQGDYRLLITDLEMPNMDGITLIHTCRARPRTARMPMLAITGHESLRAKFNECRDVAGIHRKPWVDDLLLSHVATLVGARAPRAAGSAPARTAGHPA